MCEVRDEVEFFKNNREIVMVFVDMLEAFCLTQGSVDPLYRLTFSPSNGYFKMERVIIIDNSSSGGGGGGGGGGGLGKRESKSLPTDLRQVCERGRRIGRKRKVSERSETRPS